VKRREQKALDFVTSTAGDLEILQCFVKLQVPRKHAFHHALLDAIV
jgi:hypothetical protein